MLQRGLDILFDHQIYFTTEQFLQVKLQIHIPIKGRLFKLNEDVNIASRGGGVIEKGTEQTDLCDAKGTDRPRGPI